MNLTELKAAAELAKTSTVEMDIWRESVIDPDEVLRLVEVARAAKIAQAVMFDNRCGLRVLDEALEGIEP